MYKKVLKILMLVFCVVLASTVLIACSPRTEVLPESIRISKPNIFVAPREAQANFQIEAIVLPETATNKKLTYSLSDPKDYEYLSISTTGLITGKKEKKTIDSSTNVATLHKVEIIITSQANSAANSVVFVTVEETSVKDITFETASAEIRFDDNDYAVKPIIHPSHAVLNRNLIFTSNDPVISVDAVTGKVTPLSIGKASIKVSTPTDLFGNSIQKHFDVSVVYAPLSYRMEVSNKGAINVFNQIRTAPEKIELILNSTNDKCDPAPKISWFIDESRLDANNDKKSIFYEPKLSPGEYTIKAVLEDASGKFLTIEAPSKLRIYNDFTGFDIQSTTGLRFALDDTVRFDVNFRKDDYPPESFVWFLKDMQNGSEVEVTKTDKTFVNYNTTRAGSFQLIALPVVKGKFKDELKKASETFTVTSDTLGCEIFELAIEGKNIGADTLAVVKWKKLLYTPIYKVEIIKNGNISLILSSDSRYTGSFGEDYLIIPKEIATLNDSFTVRVATANFGYSQRHTYTAGTIQQGNYKFFAPLILDVNNDNKDDFGHNQYISSVEELGRLLNTILVFRPMNILTENKEYKFSVFIPFKYTDLNTTLYPLFSVAPSDLSPAAANLYKIMDTTLNLYCDTIKYSYRYIVANDDGSVDLLLTLPPLPSELLKSEREGITEANFINHYSKQPNIANYPLENTKGNVAVTTSNQLYYAVALGLNPVPVSGSAAELIMTKAKAVISRIIDNSMSNADKIHAIYDFLTLEVAYDNNLYKLATTAATNDDLANHEGFFMEGVFLRGSAVCDGIAKSFVLLSGLMGLSSYKVVGQSTSVQADNHAWNSVLINGQWYLVDATWGSILFRSINQEIQTHEYLLQDEVSFAVGHKTFGVYPKSAEKSLDVYYGKNVVANVDSIITSYNDLKNYMNDYFKDILKANRTNQLWVELRSENYNINPADFPLLLSGTGYQATVLSSALNTNTYYIKFEK